MPRWFRPRIAFAITIAASLFLGGIVLGGKKAPIEATRTGSDSTMLEVARDTRDATVRLARLQLATVLVSLPTLALLFWTFHATRRTADAAIRSSDASEQSERAHVFAEVDSSGGRFILRNYGRTPALSIQVRVYVPDGHLHLVGEPTASRVGMVFSDSVVTLESSHSFLSASKTPIYVARPVSKLLIRQEVWVHVSYQDVFGDPHWFAVEFTDWNGDLKGDVYVRLLRYH